MANDAKQPGAQQSDLTDVQLVTGGDSPWAYGARILDTTQRWFVRSADHIIKRTRPFEGLDPARPVKNAVGVAIAVESLDKAGQEWAKGHYAEAAYDGFVAANIGVTALPEVKVAGKVLIPSVNEVVADALAKAPATTKITSGVAKVLASGALNPEIKAACGALKPVPLAGAAINGAIGLWSAGSRAADGDYRGAGGELAVTATNVGVYAAGVALGVALLTAGAPALAIGGAAVGAYLASEAAAEVTARAYNHYAGTNVRGSGLATVVGYAYNRVSSLIHKEQVQHALPDWKTQKYHLNGVGNGNGYAVRNYLNAHEKESGIHVDSNGDGKVTKQELAQAIAAWNKTHSDHNQNENHTSVQAPQTPNHKSARTHAQQH